MFAISSNKIMQKHPPLHAHFPSNKIILILVDIFFLKVEFLQDSYSGLGWSLVHICSIISI